MASAVLIGVNPVHGLYASFAGPVAGGLTASTRLMVITTTTAAAPAGGSAVSGLDADRRPEALFLLTVLADSFLVTSHRSGDDDRSRAALASRLRSAQSLSKTNRTGGT
jgi:sulfate permease, SulP family